ncbi:MAG: cell wall hydrolase/autolysin [Massilibacillus sp.]|jgi:N-acetylmuramoyl-L-alanine amidase|nr:cell wall hydrolase/autolysin [Massilibacillus sp.]
MLIVINPGHCPGEDSGAVNQNTGLQEADVVLNIGNLLAGYLENVDYETKIVQLNDLNEICDVANGCGADLFISLHCNGAESTQANGTETWYYDQSEEGESLAYCIQEQIINSLGTTDRGIKSAVPHKNGLYVLTNTNMTGVLVETAFITNDSDEQLLADRQDDFARAIARGITDYIK